MVAFVFGLMLCSQHCANATGFSLVWDSPEWRYACQQGAVALSNWQICPMESQGGASAPQCIMVDALGRVVRVVLIKRNTIWPIKGSARQSTAPGKVGHGYCTLTFTISGSKQG